MRVTSAQSPLRPAATAREVPSTSEGRFGTIRFICARRRWVELYYIDSAEGLRLFTKECDPCPIKGYELCPIK